MQEMKFPWTPLGQVPLEEVREARKQAHNAVQWLARYARCFLLAVPDDSHTALLWNPFHGSLNTAPIEVRNNQVIFSFDFFTLAIQAKTSLGSILFEIPINGLTNPEVEKKFREILSKFGFPLSLFETELPYSLGPWEMADEERYEIRHFRKGAVELSKYFTNAQNLIRAVGQKRRQTFECFCWPHHFDLATFIVVEENDDPEKAKSVGFGLSPGDETYEDPYFYITPWPYPEDPEKTKLPAPVFWHTKGFVAGIVTADGIKDKAVAGNLGTSLHESISICESLLTK